MISSNGSMIYKNIFLSFINKKTIVTLLILFLILMIPLFYLVVSYWNEMPIMIKIFAPIFLSIILIGIVIVSLNGMIVKKNGTIIFIPDFRVKRVKLNEIKKLVINFSEWNNKKYSAHIKIIYEDNHSFHKDYSNQFKNIKNKKIVQALYTLPKMKVDRICEKIIDLNIFSITIIDKNSNIIYQKR